jgi:predicted DNA-binding mobile mystery protein A
MTQLRQASRARQTLDERLENFPPASAFTPPARGWIRAVRSALGMSYRQLAARVGLHPTAIAQMERSEEQGTIQLSTLRRAADALDCTLVYALVPRQSLEHTVRQRAREVARRQLGSVHHTMKLEDQAVPLAVLEKQLDLFARSVNPRELWDD